MANTVKIRNSSTAAAAPSSLEAGELAINTADAKLFWEDSAGAIQTTYLLPSFDDLSSTSHASTHATGGSDAIAPADIGAAPAASPTFTGVITVSAGSAAAPSVVGANGGTAAGQWFPATNTVAWSTSGVERMRIGAGGAVSVADRLQVPRGSAATPCIQVGGYVGDYDSGLFSPTSDTVAVATAGVERVRVDSSGNVCIGAASATAKLDINDDIMRLRTAKTPASSSDTGNTGDICWDSSYLYICTAANTWRRIAHSTW